MELASRLSEGNGAVSEAGKSVFYISIHRKMFSYAGACVAQQQRKHVLRNSSTDIPVTSRGNMTKHVLDVLPFKSTTWYQRVRAIIC